MEEKFSSWLVSSEGKLEATGRSYSRAINKLSQHYSSFSGNPTDIYKVDLNLLKKIRESYESNGRFSEVGYESHGLYRAAIKAFYRYRISHPVAPKNTRAIASPKLKREKTKGKTFSHRILEFFSNLFQKKHLQKIPAGYLVGTKKQISKHLIPLLDNWKKEVHEKYITDNPQCQRCKSKEFPEVIEKPQIPLNNILKVILKDYSEKAKQTVLVSDLQGKFKSQIACGDRLMVLCRTCRNKEEDRKVERYPHEMPPVMRKGPTELRY